MWKTHRFSASALLLYGILLQIGRWRKEGDVTDIPRALYRSGYNWLGSDRYVEDASFLRFRTITLRYTASDRKMAEGRRRNGHTKGFIQKRVQLAGIRSLCGRRIVSPLPHYYFTVYCFRSEDGGRKAT